MLKEALKTEVALVLYKGNTMKIFSICCPINSLRPTTSITKHCNNG